MNTALVAPLDDKIDVRQRLQQLSDWHASWKDQVAFLDQQIAAISDAPNPREVDLQKAEQISSLRRRLELQQVKMPFEISPQIVKTVGYRVLRQHLVKQFVQLSKAERVFWLNN